MSSLCNVRNVNKCFQIKKNEEIALVALRIFDQMKNSDSGFRRLVLSNLAVPYPFLWAIPGVLSREEKIGVDTSNVTLTILFLIFLTDFISESPHVVFEKVSMSWRRKSGYSGSIHRAQGGQRARKTRVPFRYNTVRCPTRSTSPTELKSPQKW